MSLRQRKPGSRLTNSVYALDSTTIDLCMSVFPWAHFRSTKSAVKMHTLLDLRGNIPSFIHISNGKLHDVHALDMLIPEPGAVYVMDRDTSTSPACTRCIRRAPSCDARQVQSACASDLFRAHRPSERRDRRSNHRIGRPVPVRTIRCICGASASATPKRLRHWSS